MVHISKKKLAPRTINALSDFFLVAIVHARTKRDAHALVSELFGPEERALLAKRFAIIAMLVGGYSTMQIADMLKVSPNTVARIWQNLKKGQYPHVARYAKNNRKNFEGESFMDALGMLLSVGGIM